MKNEFTVKKLIVPVVVMLAFWGIAIALLVTASIVYHTLTWRN